MAKSPTTINDALRGYDRASASERVKKAEDLRSELRERFPMERWREMALEEYALGQDDSANTFCRWMEFRSRELGSIGGGSSYKMVIFKRKKTSEWAFPSAFDDVAEAWQKLRSEFVQALEHASNGEWDRIDELAQLQSASALRLKTLHLYFPAEILSVYSVSHLKHFLKLLEPDQEGPIGGVALNRKLLEALRAVPELDGWSTTEMMFFLYQWADPRDARRVVKIAPGPNAKYWEDCLNNGYICVGWDAVGDLTAFDSKDDFREAFFEKLSDLHKGHKPTLSKKAKEVWTLSELSPGDLVVANQGTSRVLAVGTVTEPGYCWDDSREEYKHTVSVDWDTSYAKPIPPQKRWATVTVAKVPQELFATISAKSGGGDTDPPIAIPVDPVYGQIADALERKGQLIVYGPPGTGKTYVGRRFSVWWLLKQRGENADRVLVDTEALRAEEKRLSTTHVSRRTWFVVANPKEWSWDRLKDEGHVTYRYGRLKRNYPLLQEGDLVVGYQSNPDKRIVALARVTREFGKVVGDDPTFEIEHVAQIKSGPTYDELQQDPVLSQSEPLSMRCQGTLFALSSGEADRLMSLLQENAPDLLLDEGEEVGQLTRVTFHPSYTYEDFVEGFRPFDGGGGSLSLRLESGMFKRVCRAAQADPDRPYLVLVDEFNRGNVAKILGELLTLLELDKRGLTVTLPQSKEAFSVPPNVFMLGTMNTADRSIKLLDAALRRRFAFVELMPDLDLLRGATVGSLALDDFLDGLNRRIAQYEGREKQIGHAYLLEKGQPISEPEDFARRFREELLPLLQEYCYDDYTTLAKYIGAKLVDGESQALDREKLDDADGLVALLAQEFGSSQESAE